MNRRPGLIRVWTVLSILLLGMGFAVEASAAPGDPLAFFTVVPPCRVFDSRETPPQFIGDGPAFSGGVSRFIPIVGSNGNCNIPAEAEVVTLNVTVTQPTTGGKLFIGPGGSDLPSDAMEKINFTPGSTRANNAMVTLAAGGIEAEAATGGTVHVILDITGYYAPAGAANDTATVQEDAAATTIDVLANDLNPGATITSVTQPVNGTVVITNAGADLTYQPDANYCNTPPGTTLDTFTYTTNPGNFTATVSVTVNCVDDDPVAVDDAATVAEDAPATAIDVLANDTDVDGGPISVTAVTQPANGTVVITGGGTGLTYQPKADYCNNPPGTTLDTFTYTLTPGGDTATVSVTVNCNDGSPTANNDSATVNEDAAATAINVLANDTDEESDPFFIASASDPANGTVVLTGGSPGAHTGLIYQPDPNYCNTQPGGTPDTFTYTLTPGGSTATVTVTVTCVEDDPVAVDDAATVAEDAAATAIDVLANDTDVDGGTKAIASATDPANGTVVLTGGTPGAHTGLTYQPDANYCNTQPGGTPDTFTYTLTPGGDTATVSVTVTCVEGDPVAVDDTATVAEDAGPTAINVLANDTDDESDPFFIVSASDPANGTVVLTGGSPGSHTGLTYQPDPNYCNTQPGGTPDTFTYTLTPGGDTATVSVTVTCAEDDPTAVADAATVAEDSGATTINVLANDTDPDGGTKTISSVTQPTNGTVVITNAGADLTYQPNTNYCNSQSGGTPDTFTYTLTPGGSTATVSVTVTCVDDSPTAVNDAATVAEDSGATAINVLANDTDPDGGTNTISAVTQPTNGAVVITGGGTGLTYQPNPNFCTTGTPDTFTYTLSPGGTSATVSVTVTCLDDNPTAVNDADTVQEDAAATPIDVLANDTDPDGGARSITSVTQPTNGAVVITGGGTGLTYQPSPNYCNTQAGGTLDTFTYTLTPGGTTATVSMTVTCVEDNPTAVNDAATVLEDATATAINVLANDTDPDGGTNTISAVTQPANGTVAITGGGTGLTYQPSPNYCNSQVGGTPDTFTYTLAPGGSVGTVSVTVTCVDDNPTAVADATTVLEDAAATAIDVLANDTDLDGGPKSVDSVTQPTNGAVVITGGGTGLTYQPNANYCNTQPGGTPDTFTYSLSPGNSTATVSVTVTCVNDIPQVNPAALRETFHTIGNTALEFKALQSAPPSVFVSGKLLDHFFPDPDGPMALSVALGTATAGASVTVSPDGSFTYVPPAGATGSDTFTYVVTDGADSVTRTVTVNLVERVWFVKNNATAGGLGRSSDPFDTLAEAQTASGPNDFIFVYRGNGTNLGHTAGIVLKNGQRLLGEHTGLSVPTPTGFNGAGAAGNLDLVTGVNGNRPLIGDAAGSGVSATDAVPLDISGVSVASSTNAINWTTTAGFAGTNTGLTVRDVVVLGAGGKGINILLQGTGALRLALQNNDLTSTGTALDIQETGTGALTITVFDTLMVNGNTGGTGINIVNAIFDSVPGGGANNVDGNNLAIGATGNPVSGAGLMMTGVQGSLSFDDLDIFAGTSGLTINGPLAFTVTPASPDGSGTSSIDADNGAAVDITNATIDLRLDRLESTTAGSGVTLSGVGGQFRAPSGSSITKSSGGGTAFSVASSVSGTTVTYGGMLNVTSGAGVSLTSNTGSTIGFSGGMTLSTGANAGFSATGGGTVTVTDPPGITNNTITTLGGTALTITGTTIGASGLTFERISAGASGSPVNGIVLSNTGSLGGLTVTGTGTANSGGIIQNTTGDGISLANTRNIALNRMRVASSGGSHIDASTVTNLALNNVDMDTSTDHGILGSSITNLTISGGTFHRGGAGAEPTCNKDGVNITNLLGTSSVIGATFTRSNTRQFYVTNNSNSGLDTLTVSGTTWGTHNGPCSGDHLSVAADTGGNLKLITNGSAGENNFSTGGIGIQAAANGNGNMQASITGVETSGNTAGIAIAGTANGNISFDVFNNRSALGTGFSGTGSVALVMTCTTSGTCQGRFEGNSINHTAGTATNAMQVVIEGNGTGRVQISNNTISGNCQRCLHAQSRSGSGSLSLHVTNNNLTATDAAGLQVMNFEVGASGGGTTNSICLNLANNTATPAGGMSAYRLLHRAGYTYQLQNLVQASTTNTADVQTWVTTTKSNVGAPVSVTVGSSPFTTSAGCATPTLPTP